MKILIFAFLLATSAIQLASAKTICTGFSVEHNLRGVPEDAPVSLEFVGPCQQRGRSIYGECAIYNGPHIARHLPKENIPLTFDERNGIANQSIDSGVEGYVHGNRNEFWYFTHQRKKKITFIYRSLEYYMRAKLICNQAVP